MENAPRIIGLVLKAVALGFLPGAAGISTQMTVLAIGLFDLALAALQKEEKMGDKSLWTTR